MYFSKSQIIGEREKIKEELKEIDGKLKLQANNMDISELSSYSYEELHLKLYFFSTIPMLFNNSKSSIDNGYARYSILCLPDLTYEKL